MSVRGDQPVPPRPEDRRPRPKAFEPAPPPPPDSKPPPKPRSSAASPLYEKGVRVILCGDHPFAGKEATLVALASETFKVWAVKLDNGHDTGASESQMVSERA